MQVTVAQAQQWAERYFLAWKTNDAAMAASLFAPDAVYFYGPFRPPARGRDEIVAKWVAGGVATDFASSFEVVAVREQTAVIHWRVSFSKEGLTTEMDGVLIVELDGGLCSEHREWYAVHEVQYPLTTVP